jgi:2-polyprenyl-6-methoxyphenol hydroxylase-like FAD-dependent oxidoreductase
MATRHADVVGGGIGGLTAAACLAQSGWHVTLHERSPELREIGAGIYLKENSLRVLESLGCIEHVLRHCNRIRHTFINDRPHHELRRVAYGDERVFTILRQDLHRELAEVARRSGVQIKLSSAVRQVSPDGTVDTAEGTHRADLVVGADGVGSIVRRDAGLERLAERMGSGSTRMLVPRLPDDPIDTSGEYWRGHHRVLLGPINAQTLYLCASSLEKDPRAVAVPLDIAYWSELFPELAHLFARVTTCLHQVHPRVRVSGWSRGRIALLGDAVHGQPPNLGQGAGMAIRNAGALAKALDQHLSVDTALAAWERDNRKLTEQVQNWSLGWEHVMHRWPKALLPLRSTFVLALARNRVSGRYWQGLYRGTGNR